MAVQLKRLLLIINSRSKQLVDEMVEDKTKVLGNVGWYLMLYLWSGPPESYCWFSFALAFQLFRAVELFHLCNLLIFVFSEM